LIREEVRNMHKGKISYNFYDFILTDGRPWEDSMINNPEATKQLITELNDGIKKNEESIKQLVLDYEKYRMQLGLGSTPKYTGKTPSLTPTAIIPIKSDAITNSISAPRSTAILPTKRENVPRIVSARSAGAVQGSHQEDEISFDRFPPHVVKFNSVDFGSNGHCLFYALLGAVNESTHLSDVHKERFFEMFGLDRDKKQMMITLRTILGYYPASGYTKNRIWGTDVQISDFVHTFKICVTVYAPWRQEQVRYIEPVTSKTYITLENVKNPWQIFQDEENVGVGINCDQTNTIFLYNKGDTKGGGVHFVALLPRVKRGARSSGAGSSGDGNGVRSSAGSGARSENGKIYAVVYMNDGREILLYEDTLIHTWEIKPDEPPEMIDTLKNKIIEAAPLELVTKIEKSTLEYLDMWSTSVHLFYLDIDIPRGRQKNLYSLMVGDDGNAFANNITGQFKVAPNFISIMKDFVAGPFNLWKLTGMLHPYKNDLIIP
jgi:hypothetical protein